MAHFHDTRSCSRHFTYYYTSLWICFRPTPSPLPGKHFSPVKSDLLWFHWKIFMYFIAIVNTLHSDGNICGQVNQYLTLIAFKLIDGACLMSSWLKQMHKYMYKHSLYLGFGALVPGPLNCWKCKNISITTHCIWVFWKWCQGHSLVGAQLDAEDDLQLMTHLLTPYLINPNI